MRTCDTCQKCHGVRSMRVLWMSIYLFNLIMRDAQPAPPICVTCVANYSKFMQLECEIVALCSVDGKCWRSIDTHTRTRTQSLAQRTQPSECVVLLFIHGRSCHQFACSIQQHKRYTFYMNWQFDEWQEHVWGRCAPHITPDTAICKYVLNVIII